MLSYFLTLCAPRLLCLPQLLSRKCLVTCQYQHLSLKPQWVSIWQIKLASFLDGEYIQADEGLLRQGYGTHTTVDGLSYYGNWSGDKMNGQGEF